MIKPMDARCGLRGLALAKTLGVLDPLRRANCKSRSRHRVGPTSESLNSRTSCRDELLIPADISLRSTTLVHPILSSTSFCIKSVAATQESLSTLQYAPRLTVDMSMSQPVS
jgi:hypothetical protein